MNHEDILRMAKEADVWVAGMPLYQPQLERFAALVAATEREACAKAMNDLSKGYVGDDDFCAGRRLAMKDAERTIRARGEKP